MLESGYRLPPPPGCPRHIYCAMIQCWYEKQCNFALCIHAHMVENKEGEMTLLICSVLQESTAQT